MTWAPCFPSIRKTMCSLCWTLLAGTVRTRRCDFFIIFWNRGLRYFSLLRMITGQLELILSIKEMKENGMNLTQIQKKLGVHQFRVKKAAAVGGNCSVSYLKNILSEAYQVDEHIKTGLFDGQLALEYFIAKL